jgi:hypothetical protein
MIGALVSLFNETNIQPGVAGYKANAVPQINI